MAETLFDLPNSPEEFGVLLPPSNLRRIDFSGLDYDTARRSIVEYIRTYFPDIFNDFVASNGIIMLAEIIAGESDKLSLRNDIQANDAYITTSKSEEAVVNHLALIGQRIRRQTPAVADVEVSLNQPLSVDMEVPAGTQFTINTSDDVGPIRYEIYRAPNDFVNSIVVPAGKRAVIAYGIEGQFASPVQVTSPGGANQRFTIEEANALSRPIFVDVITNSVREAWQVIYEPIEKYESNDKVVEVNFFDNTIDFKFGDDINGAAPLSGQTIEFRYRVGGGIRGRIGVGQINTSRQFTPNPPANAVATVNFRNISPSAGGTDRESLENAKRRAPREFAVHDNIVTSDDYAQVASTFSHPVFGAISKAVATVRTSKNANRVEIYALAEGPDSLPIAPNAGLKTGLVTFLSDKNVATDHTVILDGALKPVDIDMNIVVDRNADASVVQEKCESAITDFFDITQWELGEEFFVSKFIEVIEAIDGVGRVDLFAPANNILQTGKIADPDSDGIGFNELIVEGKRSTNYFYSPVRRI